MNEGTNSLQRYTRRTNIYIYIYIYICLFVVCIGLVYPDIDDAYGLRGRICVHLAIEHINNNTNILPNVHLNLIVPPIGTSSIDGIYTQISNQTKKQCDCSMQQTYEGIDRSTYIFTWIFVSIVL
jgi:hypothetical protein